MYVAICDDERAMRNTLAVLINEYASERAADICIDLFADGRDLIRSEKKYDVIFMDYLLVGMDGIETAGRLRAENRGSTIIFVSAYPEAAPDTFEVGTFRFLKKPLDKHKLFKALDDYQRSLDCDSIIIFKTRQHILKIKTSDMVYAEAKGRHTVIRTVYGCFDVPIHLKAVENMLPKENFIRCHRSYIAALEHIRCLTGSEIFFDNGEKALLGNVYSTSFKKTLQHYVIRYNAGKSR